MRDSLRLPRPTAKAPSREAMVMFIQEHGTITSRTEKAKSRGRTEQFTKVNSRMERSTAKGKFYGRMAASTTVTGKKTTWKERVCTSGRTEWNMMVTGLEARRADMVF